MITLLANGFSAAMWLLFRTLRLRLKTSTPGTSPYADSSQRYLYSVWHDSMVIPVFGGKHRYTAALTSRHADGSFVAQVLKFNDISAVRGSTNRITFSAIRELMQRTATHHIVITPDGPRGPARCMSIGIVFLAARTGRAVIPTGFACSKYWRCRGSWSDLIIPKPFANVILLAGAPIYVPPNLATEQLHVYMAEIQATMDSLNELAESEIRRNVARDAGPRQVRHRLASEAPCREELPLA